MYCSQLKIMDLRQQQIQNDSSKNNSLIGSEYHIVCPDDSNWYKTVYFKRNIMTGTPQSFLSNKIYGTPPDNIPPLPKNLYNRINSINNQLPF